MNVNTLSSAQLLFQSIWSQYIPIPYNQLFLSLELIDRLLHKGKIDFNKVPRSKNACNDGRMKDACRL